MHLDLSKWKLYKLMVLILLLSAIELSLGGSSPYTSRDKKIRISIHKRNNTKNTVQTIKNTVNTSTHVIKTPAHYKTHTTHTHTLQNPFIHTPKHYKTHTYTHSHITKLTHKNPYITKPTHTHTHTLQNPHIHTLTLNKTHTYTSTHYKT